MAKYKYITKVISVFLAIVLILQIVPMNVFAEEVSNYFSIDNDYINDADLKENIDITGSDAIGDSFDVVCEVPDKRSESEKHFLLSNGAYMAVAYSEPVHFKNSSSDEWKEIDNTLIEKTDEASNVYLMPTDSPIDVKFEKNGTSEKLVEYTVDGNILSWSYEDGEFGLLKNSSNAKKNEKNNNGNKDKNTEKTHKVIEKTSDGITYKNFYKNVDIEFIVTPTGVKENIILNSSKVKHKYNIKYNIGELTAVQTDSQTITLYDGEAAKAVISAPYMTDSNMTVSTDVEIKIKSQNKGILKAELSVNKEWLADKQREYPVKIDPYISKANMNINNDATALENEVTSNYPHGSLYVGKSSSYGRMRSYLKFNLPTLSKGDMVVGAQVSLCQFDFARNGFSTRVGATSSQINISKVTGNWTDEQIINSAGFSDLPSYDSTVLDYVTTKPSTCGQYATFNVGRTVKDWYNGTVNYGFVLWAKNETELTYSAFASANFAENQNYAKPWLTVIYLNNKGLEDRWTYHSQSLGESGTSYINDCTGNLVFVSPVYSTSGQNSPASVSLVYNGYLAGDAGVGYGKAGYGWRFDFQQKIIKINNGASPLFTSLYEAGFRYIYLDADGTEHYFKAKSGSSTVFEDEEGLSYTLTVNESSADAKFTLETKAGTKNIYKSDGGIRKICDADGNYYQYVYSNNQVSYIKDGGDRKISFTYNSNGYVATIKDPANRVTTLTYSGNLLQNITYPDGAKTQFVYTSNKLSKVTGISGVSLEYSYPASGEANEKAKVIKVQELGTNNSQGNYLNVSYNSTHSTVFTDNHNRSETFLFDNYGRTVCVNDANGGGSKYEYSSASTSAMGNKLTAASSKTKYVNNLLKNHSFENSTNNWSTEGSSGGTASASTESAFLGTKSLKITKQNTTNLRLYQKININSTTFKVGGTYTFSAYVKTTAANTQTSIYANCFDNSSGSNVSLGTYKSIVINDALNDYKRISVYFTIPAGTDFVNFVLSSKGNSGTSYFDCIQVEEGKTVNDYNMLENSDFSDASSTVWVKSSKVGANSSITEGIINGKFVIGGESIHKKNTYQIIPVNRKASECAFSLSGYAKADSVPLRATDDGDERRFSLNTYIIYTDNTEQYNDFPFEADITENQYISCMIKADANKQSKTIKEIRVRLTYYFNENFVEFDNISLNFDETGTTYTYDEDGNLVSAKDNADKNQTYTYSDADNLVTSNYEDNTSYTYTYDENGTNKHRLLSAQSVNSNIEISYGYNAKGSVTTVTVEGSDGKKIVTSNEYSGTNSNDLSATVDALGNRINYIYDTVYNYSERTATGTGLLTSVTDSAGNVTNYQYNSNNDLLTNVSAGGASVSYSYDNNSRDLEIITTGTQQYKFDYDVFKNLSQVSVGEQRLVYNSYNSNNGTLNSVDYANGDFVTYSYDNLDRIVTKVYTEGDKNSSASNSWAYNNKGQIARYYDATQSIVYNYTYDLIGRPIELYRNDNSYIRTAYDSKNLTTGITYGMGSVNESAAYTYSEQYDNAPTQTTFTDGSYSQINYDSLGRVTSYGIASPTTALGFTSFVYKNNGSNTSSLVSGVNYSSTLGIDNLSYTYDSRGNITEIEYVNGSDIYCDKYYYDSLNQLIRADNEKLQTAWLYTYGTNGNITNVKTYYIGYIGQPLVDSNLQSNINYSYGDTNWGDKLTSYNGKAIFYDEIGNMTSFDSQSFEWLGRRLTNYTKSGASAAYTYDADGIRTGKTVNGITTKYFCDGSTILLENRGGNIISYYYDATGKRASFKYNGGMYYYVYNLQGDVTHIVDANRNIVGSYTYDPWGKITNLASLTSIAQANPFRYRGYYYDTETGFYYVSSRYYDPEIGRWINADALVDQSSVLGYNLFAYCRNNPVNMTDTTGNLPFFAITAAIGAVVGAVVGGVVAAKNGGNVWAGIGIGAAAGALIGTGAGMAAGAALAGSITATTGAVMAGGSTLVATVGTGGLGAGATYIANNLSQAANNLAPAAQTAASKMQQVYEKGKAGELAANITKNHAHIDSITGTAKYRIPDMLDRSARILGEVKNYSGTISLTAQLKDFALWSQLNGYQMHLYTNSTSFTGPLQQLIDNGVIQVFPIG